MISGTANNFVDLNPGKSEFLELSLKQGEMVRLYYKERKKFL